MDVRCLLKVIKYRARRDVSFRFLDVDENIPTAREEVRKLFEKGSSLLKFRYGDVRSARNSNRFESRANSVLPVTSSIVPYVRRPILKATQRVLSPLPDRHSRRSSVRTIHGELSPMSMTNVSRDSNGPRECNRK